MVPPQLSKNFVKPLTPFLNCVNVYKEYLYQFFIFKILMSMFSVIYICGPDRDSSFGIATC